MKPFKMALPRTVPAAVDACGESFAETKLMAGGTDLLGAIKDRVHTPETVVNLKGIPGLDQIRRTNRGLEIGALVTLSKIAAHPEIQRDYPALVATIGKSATPQLRNVGTIAGNLCQRPRCAYYRHDDYPCLRKGGSVCYALLGENEFHAIFDNKTSAIVHPSNTAPVLIAHGAQIEIAGSHGSMTARPIESFFVTVDQNPLAENILGPDSVVTTIILPPGSECKDTAYVEAREKQSFDWALCGSTVLIRKKGKRIDDCRVVLSAVAPTPLRRMDLEKMLRGQEINDKLIDEVCKAAVATATPLKQNRYKLAMLKTILARAIRQAWKG